MLDQRGISMTVILQKIMQPHIVINAYLQHVLHAYGELNDDEHVSPHHTRSFMKLSSDHILG
jgi:hypothetical protein